MEEKHWIDYISAIGSMATPVLVLLLTAVGWKYRQSIERRTNLEEKLRDDRIEIYNQILEPFIILLMSDAAWQSDKENKKKDKNAFATSQMLSLEYRKLAFRLSLIGSDSVGIAYNDLLNHFYSQADPEKPQDEPNLKVILELLGNFLLEIRRSMGNETTKLDNWSMVEWFIKDARKIRKGN